MYGCAHLERVEGECAALVFARLVCCRLWGGNDDSLLLLETHAISM